MKLMLEYLDRNSFIHSLTGATKLICFIFWCIASMITYDTRLLIIMLLFSIFIFKISKIKFEEVSFILLFILLFLLINNIAIFIFSPNMGTNIYGTKTIILNLIGSYSITIEQLFYQFNITLKYFTVIPFALIFILTTNPSEFASSLNKIGISYKVSYAVSLALRYIPDVMKDYKDISISKQTRGLDLSKNEKISKRIKNSFLILIPILFSSIERIEKISCAMEIRGFGINKKRTWYNQKNFKSKDIISILLSFVFILFSTFLLFINNGRFFNPFI